MTTHAVAGAKRRCAHATFSLLGLKIYGQTWWLLYALIHPIIYFLWIGNVRKYFFHLSTFFCLKRLWNFNSLLLFQVKWTRANQFPSDLPRAGAPAPWIPHLTNIPAVSVSWACSAGFPIFLKTNWSWLIYVSSVDCNNYAPSACWLT